MMNIYTVFVQRDGEERWFNFAIMSQEQVNLLGQAFHEITRIETWNGETAYERKTVH